MTDRLSILSALKRATIREIEVAGIKIQIRGLTGAERQDFIARARLAKEGNGKVMSEAELCSWAMCTPDGERIHPDANELENVDAAALETIARAILDASGMLDEKKDAIAGESGASPS